MKYLNRTLVLFPSFAFWFLAAIFNPSFATASELPNGGFISDAISTSGEIDTYTFTANAGATVFLRVAETESTSTVSSPFSPRVSLFSPSGTFITGDTEGLVGAISQQLLESGEYSVRIQDDSFSEDETGTYNLYFASAPGANENEGGELVNGGVVSDRIDLGDIDSYAFSATAGDTVFLRVADTETTQFINSSFSPRVVLLDPNGNFLTSDSESLVGAVDRQLVITGTYTVIITDDSFRQQNVGAYDLYFALIPSAAENEGGFLVNGQSVNDRIDLGDIDTYTFFAEAGEAVFLRAADTETTQFIDSSFSPRVSLYDPDGNFVIGDDESLVAAVFSNLVKTGIYTVVVRDDSFRNENIGDYELYYTKVPGANEGGGISGGQTIDEFIDLGDIDSFAFTANTLGASVSFTVTDLDSTPMSPRVMLFDPSGSFVVGDTDSSTASISAVLTMAGQYTLVVADDSFRNENVGRYRLTGVGFFTGVPAAALTCNGLVVTVNLSLGQVATSGDDVILGTAGADSIVAFQGNDTICGLSGNDIINAGPGDDWVDAGAGNDNVFGLAGADIIMGGPGADVIVSGDDDDLILGGGGADALNGGPGDDLIFGEAGGDELFGQGGDDLMFGGDGADFLLGVDGSDELHGQNGGDILNGGLGDDVLYGGVGADTLFGLAGADRLDGGLGDDVAFGQIGADVVLGGGGNDQLFGNEGDDSITATSGTNVINGGAGNDSILGGSGTDNIFGDGNLQQAGDDVIDGGAGPDLILGFSGSDTITSTDGSVDTVNGGPDTDICTADAVDAVFNCP